MSNYKKFDLDTIKTKLKAGEYASRVGAMRAIGKTQELSDADKVKARALVAKHFPEDAPAPKAKSKKAAKKAAPKASKKAKAPRAKKSRKKVTKKAPVDKAAPATKAAAPRAKKTAKKATKKAPAASEEATASGQAATRVDKPAPVKTDGFDRSSPEDALLTSGRVISTISQAVASMETAKKLFPKAQLEANLESAVGVMSRAVEVIDQEVVRPMLKNETAKTSSAAKKSPKKGTRNKAAQASASEEPAAPEAEEEQPEDEVEDQGPANGLDEEEQLRIARETQPAALRRVTQSS